MSDPRHEPHDTAKAEGEIFVLVGETANFTYYYDASLDETGKALAQALMATSEEDYQYLVSLFGFELPASTAQGGTTPLSVYVIPSQVLLKRKCGSPQLFVSAYLGDSPDVVRFQTVAQTSQAFMTAQGQGWTCSSSNGAALSRVLATDRYPAALNPPKVLNGFATARFWLDGDRPDFVTRNQNSATDKVGLGCAALFLNYLRFQRGYDLGEIIRKGGPTLESTYFNLTGFTGAFGQFQSLLAGSFEVGKLCALHTDNPFPLRKWESLGTAWLFPPALVSPDAGTPTRCDTIHAFMVSSDGVLYRNVWNSSWLGLENVGNPPARPLVRRPAVVSRAPGLVDVFGICGKRKVWQRSWDGSQWGEWTSLGGAAYSDVAAVTMGPNRMDIFTVGADNLVHHRGWDDDGWGDWDQDHSGLQVASRPSAVVWNNEVQIVARGIDNVLVHMVYQPSLGFSYQEVLPDRLTIMSSAPVIVAPDAERLTVFFRGADMMLRLRFWYRGWGGQSTSLGGDTIVCEPQATVSAPDLVEVAAINVTTCHWNVERTGTGPWSAIPYNDGKSPHQYVVPFTVVPGLLDLFIIDVDQTVWHRRL